MGRFTNYGLALITFFSVSAFAGPTALDCQTSATLNDNASDLLKVASEVEDKDCPRIKNRQSVICDSIRAQTQDPDPDSEFNYKFESDMYKIVCANPAKESKEEINAKIRNTWIKYQDEFFCDSSTFNVPKGSMLKAAVYSKFNDFISVAVDEWKVPLNKVDKGDGRTLLDYVQFELDKSKGTVHEPVLRAYFEKLRKAGAKYKSEL